MKELILGTVIKELLGWGMGAELVTESETIFKMVHAMNKLLKPSGCNMKST